MTSEPGPFDRILDPGSPQDRTARWVFIAMGGVGLILLALVLLPVPFVGGKENDKPSAASPGAQAPSRGPGSRAAKAPDGFEVLSRLEAPPRPKGSNGPYDVTVKLLQPINDGRNIALYTNKGGKWERIASAALTNNGTEAKGQVAELPANVAVLRRTVNAVQVSAWLPSGAQPDPAALNLLTTLNPADFTPASDGALIGTATALPPGRGNVLPGVRAVAPKDAESVNSLLASPGQRDAHIAALVQLAQQPGNAGVDIDYPRVNPARKADFSAFVSVLADRLHQSNKTLTLTLPAPVKTGVNWDTGAYDWEELSRRADLIKLLPDADPSSYHDRVPEVLTYLKSKVDLKKVSLVVSRQSVEKGTDGLRPMPLKEALTLASAMEVRTTTQITPNASVVIVGKNIYQDDGASGLRWDEKAYAVSFTYPGRGGLRTVWLENALSVAFRLDLARRFGLGGIAIDDASLDPLAPAIWDPLRAYAESGAVSLVQPNGVLLRPTWQIQAGSSEAGAKGNVVWKAPAQPGAYDVSLIVSDGVIRAMQKLVLEVKAPSAATPAVTAPAPAATSSTPRPTGTVSAPAPAVTTPTVARTPTPAATPTVRP